MPRCLYMPLATVSDNCDSPTLMQTPAAGTTVSGVGSLTVTLPATDSSGNTASGTFIVNWTGSAACGATDSDGDGVLPPDDCDGLVDENLPALTIFCLTAVPSLSR